MRVNGKIYLDYQASTPTAPSVADAMLPYFTQDFGNPHSTDHLLGWSASTAITRARSSIATLIGSDVEEVFFSSGATESNNHVIYSVACSRAPERTKILVSAVEHKCVIAAAEAAAKLFDMTVERIPVRSNGMLDIERYKLLLDDNVALVAVMAVNNEIGTIQPIAELAKYAHEVGALFLCDAAQAPTAVVVDVFDWDVDFLTLSAHKIYGPKGVGAIYVRNELLHDLLPLIHGGGQQNGVRSGTLPTPLCVGFGLAADALVAGGLAERAALAAKKAHFISCLDELSIRHALNGEQGSMCHPGNISVRFNEVDAHSLLTKLHPVLCASTGSACSSGYITQSHVLRAIGLSPEESASTVRFSIGRYTDLAQLGEAAEFIGRAIETLSES